MATYHYIEEPLPPGRVVVRTGDNRVIVTPDAVRSLRSVFGDHLASGELVFGEDDREQIRWQVPEDSVAVEFDSSGVAAFLQILRECCDQARSDAADLQKTAWFMLDGGSEPPDSYSRFAPILGRPTANVAPSRVHLPQALVRHIHDLFLKAADSVEEALEHGTVFQTGGAFKLVGWGLRHEDASPTRELPPAPQIQLIAEQVGGNEHLLIVWSGHPEYGEAWIERTLQEDQWEETGHASSGATRFDLGPRNLVPSADFRIRVLTRAGDVLSAPARVNPPSPTSVPTTCPDPPVRPVVTPTVHGMPDSLPPPRCVSLSLDEGQEHLCASWTLTDAAAASGCNAEIDVKDRATGAWVHQGLAPAASLTWDLPHVDVRAPTTVRVRLLRDGQFSDWTHGVYIPHARRSQRRLLLIRWWEHVPKFWKLALLIIILLILAWILWRLIAGGPNHIESLGVSPSSESQFAPSSANSTETPPSDNLSPTDIGPSSATDIARTSPTTPTPPPRSEETLTASGTPDVTSSPSKTTNEIIGLACLSCGHALPPSPDDPFKYCPYCGQPLRRGAPQSGLPILPSVDRPDSSKADTDDVTPARVNIDLSVSAPVGDSTTESAPHRGSSPSVVTDTRSAATQSQAPSTTTKQSLESSDLPLLVNIETRTAGEDLQKPTDNSKSSSGVITSKAQEAGTSDDAQKPDATTARVPGEQKERPRQQQASQSTEISPDSGLQSDLRPTTPDSPTTRAKSDAPSPADREGKTLDRPPSQWLAIGSGVRIEFLDTAGDDNCFQTVRSGEAPQNQCGILLCIDERTVTEDMFDQIRAMRLESGDLRSYGLSFSDVTEHTDRQSPIQRKALWLSASINPVKIPRVERPISLAQVGGPDGVVISSSQNSIQVAGCPATVWLDIVPRDSVRDTAWAENLTLSFEPIGNSRDQPSLQWSLVESPAGNGIVRFICQPLASPTSGTVVIRDADGNLFARTKPIRLEFLK
jgi:hypothetical protein